MATQYQNLSNYDVSKLPDKQILEKQHYAIAVSDWNSNVTFNLLKGALDTLIENGVLEENIEIFHVPGTFELTYIASKLNNSKKYNAIVTLGCVVQGETPHFDYVCSGVTQGLTQLNLKSESCPIIFGVLTTSNMQQAIDRSGGKHGNKGVEAAVTAIKMANIIL